MMNELAIAGIKAALRLGKAGANLYMEQANDKPVFLPDIDMPDIPISGQLGSYLEYLNEDTIQAHSEFVAVWDSTSNLVNVGDSNAVQIAFNKMIQIRAEEEVERTSSGDLATAEKQEKSKLIAGGRLVEQWRKDKRPPNAFARMALTIVDVGLEFLVAKPELFGIDGKGEKFVVSFAQQLSVSIPDNVREFGNSTNFNSRVIAIFLRAGLNTLTDNSEEIFDDPKVAKLVTGIVVPVIESLPSDPAEQFSFRKTVDALLGPSAEAALKIVASDTGGYLGDDLASSEALGAVTKAVLESAAQTTASGTILQVFSKQGMVNVYKGVLQVAVEQPQLFVTAGNPPTAKEAYVQSLLSGIAGTLAADPNFKGPIGGQLAATIIAITGQHGGALLELDPDNGWDKVATKTIENIAGVISSNLSDNNKRMQLFGKQHRLQLGKIIVTEIAVNPAMLGITDELSLKITTAVATAMSEDSELLLNDEQWLKLAAITASTAVANQKLLLTNIKGAQKTILLATLTGVLKAATSAWSDTDIPKLNFGKTLLKVIGLVIDKVINNVEKVSDTPKLLENYMTTIHNFVKERQSVSSEQLILLVSGTIEKVLSSGNMPTNQELQGVLS